MRENRGRLGLVSVNAPLISNLNVLSNIALIQQYHQKISSDAAHQLVLQYLKRFGMENIAFKRNPALTHEERFCTMLVRAVMVVDALLVIDRPFQILKNHGDARFIYDALKTVSDSYAESHILDYSWNAQRYEMSHDQKR